MKIRQYILTQEEKIRIKNYILKGAKNKRSFLSKITHCKKQIRYLYNAPKLRTIHAEKIKLYIVSIRIMEKMIHEGKVK